MVFSSFSNLKALIRWQVKTLAVVTTNKVKAKEAEGINGKGRASREVWAGSSSVLGTQQMTFVLDIKKHHHRPKKIQLWDDNEFLILIHHRYLQTKATVVN